MSPGRKSHDTYPPGINLVFGRPAPDKTDSTLRILQRRRLPIIEKPVFQHERRNPEGIEPSGDIMPLISDGKIAISAAGTDDHSLSA